MAGSQYLNLSPRTLAQALADYVRAGENDSEVLRRHWIAARLQKESSK
jgi:hypothetical protein